MAARLDYVRIDPARVLDAGCGLGGDLSMLRERYPRAAILALDAAFEMAGRAQRTRPLAERAKALWRRSAMDFVCADAARLPLAGASFGLVWSNLLLAWAPDAMAVFREFHRVLEPGGLLMFSAHGPDTLRELRRSFAQSDPYPHVHTFADMHDLGDMLVAAGFAAPVMDMDMVRLTYADARSLFMDLRRTGQTNVDQARRRALVGRGTWEKMLAAYESERREGRIPATVEIVYGHAWKAEARAPRRSDDGIATIQFDPHVGRRAR